MPPKKLYSEDKVQTLSRFFTSPSGQHKKSVSDSGKYDSQKHVKTDKNNAFQVYSIAGHKRSNPTQGNNTDHPMSKHFCQKVLAGQENKGQERDLKERSRNSSYEPGAVNFAWRKLKDYEYEENQWSERSKSKLVFQSRNCPMMTFTKEDVAVKGSAVCDDSDGESTKTASNTTFSLSGGVAATVSGGEKTSLKGGRAGKYTPLEQQYLEIKGQYPDAVLFVECGYKFRFFGEDAKLASQILKIYSHMDHKFLTASIPVHRLYVHIRRIVAAGYKVGVVRQTETSHLKAKGSNKSGPFTRQLKALYTRSTLIGEDVIPLTEQCDSGRDLPVNHFLMCIYECLDTLPYMGLVCVDPATGDVIYDDFKDNSTFSELESRISHLQPVEIILSKAASEGLTKMIKDISNLSLTQDDKLRVEVMDEKVFSLPHAFAILSEFYNEDQISLQQVSSFAKPVVSCLAALSIYLQTFQLERVLTMASQFTKYSQRSCYMYLSGQCLQNLEIFHNSKDGTERGTLYWLLNHTCTKFGSRLLHKWLAQPLLDDQEIKARLDAVEELVRDKSEQLSSLRDMMSKLPDLEKGLCSIFHRKCSLIEFWTVVKALEKVENTFSKLHKPVKSKLLATLLTKIPEHFADVRAFSQQINEKAVRENDKANLFQDVSQFSDVMQRKKEIEAVLNSLHEHRKDVMLTLKQPGFEYMTVSQTEFLIEVKNNQLDQVPTSWTQISSTKAVSRFHSPFIVQQYRTLCELREQLLLDVNSSWQQLLGQFSIHFTKYKQAVIYLATLDCLMSLASTASQEGYCKPQVDSTKVHLDIKGGHHPILAALTHGQDQYVPNSTKLDADGLRVMVISGPNMGGKSSYIRQVALISILAQIGSFVPAESANLGILDAVYTRMGASDDIFQGRSTLMVELQEAGEIITQLADKSLVIMDELGRGTSTYDGMAIAYATLDYLIQQNRCLVLFVTHFPLMSEFYQYYPSQVMNCHMGFLVDTEKEDQTSNGGNSVTFLYQLTEGAAQKSYGLNVARLAHLPPDILNRAAEMSSKMEKKVISQKQRQKIFRSLYAACEEELQSIVNHWK